MEVLQFEQIRSAEDMGQRQDVEVPEWGGKLIIRPLSRAEVHAAQRAAADDEDGVDAARLDVEVLSRAVVEPEIDSAGWTEICATKGFAPIERIVRAILGSSGMLPDSLKRAEIAFRGEP